MLFRSKIDDDTLAEFLNQPTPRTVPAAIRRAAYRQSGSSGLFVIGTALVLFGAVFVIAMFPWRIDRDIRLNMGSTTIAPGVVTAVVPTGLTINHRAVYRYEFEFTVGPGEVITGESFKSGPPFRVSQPVTIRYRTDDPRLARIEGTRLTKAGAGALFVVILPMVGVAIVSFGIVARRRVRRLLESGELTEATIVGFAKTGARVNNRPVYKIELQLEGVGQAVTVRRHAPAIVELIQQRDVKGMMFVLFDPQNPKRLVFPESFIA